LTKKKEGEKEIIVEGKTEEEEEMNNSTPSLQVFHRCRRVEVKFV
jgi:hypothetical protein